MWLASRRREGISQPKARSRTRSTASSLMRTLSTKGLLAHPSGGCSRPVGRLLSIHGALLARNDREKLVHARLPARVLAVGDLGRRTDASSGPVVGDWRDPRHRGTAAVLAQGVAAAGSDRCCDGDHLAMGRLRSA